MPAKSLELKHTIKLIQELTSEINEIEDAIRKIMDELKPPILSIPGMGFYSAAMILAEVGDFSNFNSPDKVLAYGRMFSVHIPVRKTHKLLCTHGKAWLSLSSIRSLHCNQIRLLLESCFY